MMSTTNVAVMLALLTVSGMSAAYLWAPPAPAPVLHEAVDTGERAAHGAVDLIGDTGHYAADTTQDAADAAEDARDDARTDVRSASQRARDEARSAPDKVQERADDAKREVHKRLEPIPPETRPQPRQTVHQGLDAARGHADQWTERPAEHVRRTWDRLPCSDDVSAACRANFW